MARIKQGVFSWEDVLTQRYQSNKPPPLQYPRHRILTATQPQLKCGLLSRLSPELRLIIWEYVLGGRRLHIIQRTRQRLGYIVCPHSVSSSASEEKESFRRTGNAPCEICLGAGIPQPIKDADLHMHTSEEKLLSLALTSRQIYHESIHLLYTLNTFEFSNPWTLPYLFPTLPLEIGSCIRNVELRWSFPGHWLPCKDPVRAIYVSAGRAQWVETCNVLKTIPRLRSFVLIVGYKWFSEPVEKLPIFLAPLRDLNVQRSHGLTLRSAKFSEAKRSSLNSRSTFASTESGSGSGTSSDEESSSLSSGSSPAFGSFPLPTDTEMRSYCFYSTRDSSSLRSSMSDTELAGWELRFQGQPYYVHELDGVSDDLRRRGIDCYISTK